MGASDAYLSPSHQRSLGMMGNLEQLVIADSTRHNLVAYLAHPTHALMLAGEEGCGLGAIARCLAHNLAGADIVDIRPTLHNKQKTCIINADDVADLGNYVRDRRRNLLVIIIDGADRTAPGVFERLLKLIEEPVPGVHYIFTAHDLSAIPATILSRSSLIKVALPTSKQCECLYDNLSSRQKAQIKFLADRRPALICRLLNDDQDFASRAERMQQAKSFLQGDKAERIQIISGLSEREQGIELCEYLLIMIKRLSDPNLLHYRLDLLEQTASRLQANGNVKLQLINLAVNF